MQVQAVDLLDASRTGPADLLAGMLSGLRAHLAALAECTHQAESGECLERLYDFMLDDLLPVVRAVDIRIRPALRGPTGEEDRQAAAETAALARLSEQVALLRAESARSQTGTNRPQLLAMTERMIRIADAHLTRAELLLPAQLRGLPADRAKRIVASTRRTAHAVAAAPRFDLIPSRL